MHRKAIPSKQQLLLICSANTSATLRAIIHDVYNHPSVYYFLPNTRPVSRTLQKNQNFAVFTRTSLRLCELLDCFSLLLSIVELSNGLVLKHFQSFYEVVTEKVSNLLVTRGDGVSKNIRTCSKLWKDVGRTISFTTFSFSRHFHVCYRT